ncbi:hypothetical protein [Streptomyces fagopyri]|uniref:hypothetical protein n=1 Tax=Streptomyces fagopyri TaxID=2662397 RepID=UPI0038217F79
MEQHDGKVTISIEIEPKNLSRVADAHLAMLWHLAQANPAPHADAQAGELVRRVGNEIIRRWLAGTPPEMYHHQPHSYYWKNLGRFASYRNGEWVLDPDKVSKLGPPPPAFTGGHHLPGTEYRYCGADLDREDEPHTCHRQIAHKGECSPRRDPEGCPRNVIDGDVGGHFYKKGALSDSPVACTYCGAKKPAEAGDA